jgi:hypothetical protein
MFEKIMKLIISYLLHHGIKKSDLTDWHFNVKESDGTYILDVVATITIETKKELTPGEKRSKNLIILGLTQLDFDLFENSI